MTIKKVTTLEFYKIEFTETEINSNNLFTFDFNEHSDGKTEITKDFNLIFNYLKNKIDEDDNREILIRKKKHKVWIDDINKDEYILSFSARENHNGAVIKKSDFNITLAKDEKLDFELVNISHFVIDKSNTLLALESFEGSTSKSSLESYFNTFLKETNLRLSLSPIPRDDLEQVLDDVKKIVNFKAKYRDIKEIMPDFLEKHIFADSRNLQLTQDNKFYQANINISFGDGVEISKTDKIISKLKGLATKKKNKNFIPDDNLLDGRIEVETNYGSSEIIKMQENLFVEKLDIKIDDDITKIEQYSNYMYNEIIEKIKAFLEKRKK